MRVLEIQNEFGLENLHLAERPTPEADDLQPGEVLLEMRAASLNFRDLRMVQGLYNPRQPLPLIPCSDGVGEVIAIGDGAEGVGRVAVGDRVATLFAQKWRAGEPTPERARSTLGGPLDGTLAERMVLPADGVVAVPDHLSDEEAATLPCAALTAWSALVAHGRIKAGDTVLLQGTGGVSIFALQFARLLGARVVITSSSDEKLERARDLGAWETINYRTTEAWGKEARKLTGGRGVDHVVEVGGAGTLEQSLAAVRMGGSISIIGVLDSTLSPVNVIPILMNQIRLQGILVGHRDSFEAMNRAIAEARLKPIVDRTFPLEETRAALDHMAAGRHFGKVCVRVG